MRRGERGFTLIEVLISGTIMALAAGAATIAIFQILRNTERNSDHMTVVRQVENAGYWISLDAQAAMTITTTDNLTSPDFLLLQWTTWNATSGNPVYYSARYSFENLSSGIGTLKRNYSNSDGLDQTSLIARYIYYDPTDVANSSNVTYQTPVLTLRLTAQLEQATETKEYRTKHRPNL